MTTSEPKALTDDSSLWFGKEAGTVAFALVLRRDAQDVWQRAHAGEAADARARHYMGQHCHGGGPEQEEASVTALHSIGESANRIPSGLSLLSRH